MQLSLEACVEATMRQAIRLFVILIRTIIMNIKPRSDDM